jgi:plasmid maintenance system antidote protein VapI
MFEVRPRYDVLEDRQPVTPIMALRLGKLCGNVAGLWFNLQNGITA